MPLRVALVLPYVARNRPWTAAPLPRGLAAAVRTEQIDLVVLPEMFRECRRREDVVPTVAELADELRVPVLSGVWVSGEKMQCAGYVNPQPKRGETRTHFYAKHSTSIRYAYELVDYATVRDAMFLPIVLGGRPLGVQLCHDMFFGLVSARLRREGADVLFDLTGNRVSRTKWRNVIRARSLEHDVPFLCTMAHHEEQAGGIAMPFAYRSGREMELEASRGTEKGGRYAIIDIDIDALGPPPSASEQEFTTKVYDDITLSLGTPGAKANICIGLDGSMNGSPAGSAATLRRVKARAGDVGVLVLPVDTIADSLVLHRPDIERADLSNYVVAFVGQRSKLGHGELLALAQLRAIEHRVGVVLLTESVREVVKSSRYKNIQRFRPTDGVYGIDASFLGGTYAYAPDTGFQGIRKEFIPQYKALMNSSVPKAAASTNGAPAARPAAKRTKGSAVSPKRKRTVKESSEQGLLAMVGEAVSKAILRRLR